MCNMQRATHTHFQRVLYAILAHCFWGLRNKEGGKTRKRRCDCDASASVACHVAVASNAIKIMRQLPAARTGCLLSNCRSPIPIPNLEAAASAAADPLVRLLRLLRRLCGMCGMMCVCGAETKGAFCAYVRRQRGNATGLSEQRRPGAGQGEAGQAETKRPCQHAASCHGCYFEQEAPPIIKKKT